MKCQNCGHEIRVNDRYYRAGKNGTVFCSKDCSYEAFEGFYAKKEINKTMERHTNHETKERITMGIEASLEEVKEVSKIDRKNLSKYEVEPKEEYKTGKPRRLSPKNCYTKSFQYILDKGEVAGVRLVHGLYRPFTLDQHCGHAWVELPDKIVFDGVLQRFYQKESYYNYYEIIKEVEYKPSEMYSISIPFGTYGPWY